MKTKLLIIENEVNALMLKHVNGKFGFISETGRPFSFYYFTDGGSGLNEMARTCSDEEIKELDLKFETLQETFESEIKCLKEFIKNMVLHIEQECETKEEKDEQYMWIETAYKVIYVFTKTMEDLSL